MSISKYWFFQIKCRSVLKTKKWIKYSLNQSACWSVIWICVRLAWKLQVGLSARGPLLFVRESAPQGCVRSHRSLRGISEDGVTKLIGWVLNPTVCSSDFRTMPSLSRSFIRFNKMTMLKAGKYWSRCNVWRTFYRGAVKCAIQLIPNDGSSEKSFIWRYHERQSIITDRLFYL